jgi:ABC-2 type transport system ATP-binding protein
VSVKFQLMTIARLCGTTLDVADFAIACDNLTCRFGDVTAVNGLSLGVATGQFFGFLGSNGAGKSTTIKMLTGLLEPTAGEVKLLGRSLRVGSIELKRQLGVVPEGMALFGRLTAAEYLRFVGKMYGLDGITANSRCEELLTLMNLTSEHKKLITTFSHGMQKKLALAAAVIHSPKILFLDEPFEGVDAVSAGTLKALLQSMINSGATVFLTSHVLEIVERLCSHVAIIDKGTLVANGSIEELRSGVTLNVAKASPNVSDSREHLTLEEIFLHVIRGERAEHSARLSWLS